MSNSDKQVGSPLKTTMTILLAATLLCAGCSRMEARSPEMLELSRQTIQAHVHEIKLEDGTRCVVFQDSYKGGITCDWRQ